MRGFIFLVLLALIFSSAAFAQQTIPKEYLLVKKIPALNDYFDDGSVSIDKRLILPADPKLAKEIKELNDSPSSEGTPSDFYYPFNIKLSLDDKSIYSVICIAGPEVDCTIADIHCKYGNPDHYPYCDTGFNAFLNTTHTIIPGDGCIYVNGGDAGGYQYDVHKKACFSDHKFVEAKQPFLYVGLKSKALADILLFFEKELKTPIAKIEKGQPVEVILQDESTGLRFNQIDNNLLFLLRDQYGITGWAEIKYSPDEGYNIIEKLNARYYKNK